MLSMLSKIGKEAFFPKKGILAQTAEAKGTEFNATIGQAFEDNLNRVPGYIKGVVMPWL